MGELTLPARKSYYRSTVTKRVWYWCKDWYIGTKQRIQGQITHIRTIDFKQKCKDNSMGKGQCFQALVPCLTIGLSMCKNWTSIQTLKWILTPNIKPKAANLKTKSRKKSLWSWNMEGFCSYATKNMIHKEKQLINWTSSKLIFWKPNSVIFERHC